jgi:hypothetical protein
LNANRLVVRLGSTSPLQACLRGGADAREIEMPVDAAKLIVGGQMVVDGEVLEQPCPVACTPIIVASPQIGKGSESRHPHRSNGRVFQLNRREVAVRNGMPEDRLGS